MRNPLSPLAIGGIAALLTFFVDQATKAVIISYVTAIGSGIAVMPGFNLVVVRNDGVTFGLLGGAPWWALVVLALIICAWLAMLLVRTAEWLEALAYGSIIGGALGNVIDRVRFRAVTDFLDFHVGSLHWPTFNMADVFVVTGAGMLVIASIIRQ